MLPSRVAWPLFDAQASRRIEAEALAGHAPHALMQRAGTAVARLALAVAPGARRVWVMAGPGNNGGDGLVAAHCLKARGWAVRVFLAGDAARMPPDAALALQDAQQCGLTIELAPPDDIASPDLAIDALLGLGTSRAPTGPMAQAIKRLNRLRCPVIAVDLPSGLCVDRGNVLGEQAVRATHTLCLLTAKPGLFTAQGRDHAGRVWLDSLGVALDERFATAHLLGPPHRVPRLHAQHKGSFGDLLVVGGAPGMPGAALLAARAGLAAGAGRVFLVRLDTLRTQDMAADPLRPELMTRLPAQALVPQTLRRSTVVCGCGGGDAVIGVLPLVLHHAGRLVLDADGLNAVAADASLRTLLIGRAARGLPTIVTPHPLEAARLMGLSTTDVQADRLLHAASLAAQLDCTVVLKGSGTVVASPGRRPAVNPTGNARLSTAGSGDVLAGWMAGHWAAVPQADGFEPAGRSVWLHGRAAECASSDGPLPAADLIDAMVRVHP